MSIYVAADEVNFRERFFKQLKDRDQDGYLDMVCINICDVVVRYKLKFLNSLL